jgi:general secretion pathway protein G
MESCPFCGAPYPDGATHCGSCGQPVTGSAQTVPKGGSAMKTVVIVAVAGGCLLVGIAVAGIVAALVIPNFLDATQKAKQKRTVGDVRTIASVLETYRESTGSYPKAASNVELAPLLAAHGYQGSLDDSWRHPLRYSCLQPAGDACASYELSSGGRDGVFEHGPGEYPQEAFEPNAYDSDIVIGDGLFNRWPSGQGRMATGGS